MAHDSSPPLRLSNDTNVRMPLYLLLSLLLVCSGAAIAWANVSGRVAEIDELRARVNAHDRALNKIELMANDIAWIKERMSEQRTITTTTTRLSQQREP